MCLVRHRRRDARGPESLRVYGSFASTSLLDYPAMNTLFRRTIPLALFAASVASAQEVIPLYNGAPPGSAPESYPEKQYFSKSWNTEVVANVTKPSLTVFKPAPDQKNETAAIV